jgi:hypothetical protein
MAGTTASIQTAARTLVRHYAAGLLDMTFLNGEATAKLYDGQEVVLSANGTVVDRSATTSVRPLGVVRVGGDAGTNVSVTVFGVKTIEGNAKGGTLAAGDYVRQDGTVGTDNAPNYVAAGSTTVATGIVLRGATATNPIEVLVLPQPTVV